MKNPKGRINKALYFFGGGASAATVANPAQGPQTIQQEIPSINAGFGNQESQLNQFVSGQPLLNAANQGVLNYWGPIAQSGGALTGAQLRDVNQSTLSNASTLGSAFSPNTLGSLAVNEQSARENRMSTATNALLGTEQSNVSDFTTLTNPILAFLSNMFGQNTQANIAQAQLSTQASLANQSKTSGLIGSGISSVGSIAGAAIGLSDERMKRNIRDTGLVSREGVPVKTFEYITRPGHTMLGVLAQDVEDVSPESVVEDPVSGVKMVDAERYPIFHIGREAAA